MLKLDFGRRRGFENMHQKCQECQVNNEIRFVMTCPAVVMFLVINTVAKKII